MTHFCSRLCSTILFHSHLEVQCHIVLLPSGHCLSDLMRQRVRKSSLDVGIVKISVAVIEAVELLSHWRRRVTQQMFCPRWPPYDHTSTSIRSGVFVSVKPHFPHAILHFCSVCPSCLSLRLAYRYIFEDFNVYFNWDEGQDDIFHVMLIHKPCSFAIMLSEWITYWIQENIFTFGLNGPHLIFLLFFKHL